MRRQTWEHFLYIQNIEKKKECMKETIEWKDVENRD